MSSSPELTRITRQQALALDASAELGARAQSLRDALGATREREFTLVRGEPRSLVRTYGARLAEAQKRRVPAAGLQALIDTLRERLEDPVWGFAVRDATITYLAFTDAEVSELVGIVALARSGADGVLYSV